MSLLDDLRNLLARHLAHVSSQTNQGTVRLIEDHLARLDAVVSNDLAAAEAKVHEVLGELYAATNGAAPVADVPPVVPVAPVTPVVADPIPVATDPEPAAPSTPPVSDPAPADPPAADPLPAETAAAEPVPADPTA